MLLVIRVDMNVVTCSRYRNICEAPVDERFSCANIQLNKDPILSLTLTAVAGDRVAVVKMERVAGAERQMPPYIERHTDRAGRVDAIDRSELTVRDVFLADR